MEATSHYEYRIAPELRRCSWYCIFGGVVIVALSYWIAPFIPNRAPPSIAASLMAVAVITAAALVPLRWKLRVNDAGLSRRLIWSWSYWSWTDLSSGRISKLHPHTLYDPARPWWNRRLRMGYMDSDCIHDVFAVINAHYRLPPAPDLPDRLTIRFGWRRQVTFDDFGVQVIIRQTPHYYAWREVRAVHITRMDPLRRDFLSLVITLPDQELELKLVTHHGGTTPTWRGATAEEINEFLLRNVVSDRIDVSVAGQPLTKRQHIEKKLAAIKKLMRELKIMMAILLPPLVATLAWMAVSDGVFKAIVMTAISALGIGPVLIYVYRAHLRQISELSNSLGSAK